MSTEDRSYFYHLMEEICVRYFNATVIPLPNDPLIDHLPVLIFGDFMQTGATAENKVYEEITDMERLKYVLQVLHSVY
jgi:dynein heavy chain